MRRTILAMLTIAFGFLYSCTNTNSTESTHSFAGTFITENGVRFELRADSTTLITFSDSVKYEGTWKSCKADDHLEHRRGYLKCILRQPLAFFSNSPFRQLYAAKVTRIYKSLNNITSYLLMYSAESSKAGLEI